MEVLSIEEHEDGSATFNLDLTEEETSILVEKSITDILKEVVDMEDHLVKITDAQDEVFKWCFAHFKGIGNIIGLDNNEEFIVWRDFVLHLMSSNKG